jgi:lipid II:glycine glycyltransferase (peptidoglycan interpeptide bridge formation enzyme)
MAEQDIELGVEDLMNALRIFNSATERGAFKASELSFVGRTYDKFSNFVKAAQEQQAQIEAAAQEVEEEPAPAPKKTRAKKKVEEPADGGEFDE